MSEHEALIEWSSDGHFGDGSYSRAHSWTFDGGAVVRGSSSPSVVPPPRSDPAAVDPEEALVASASSCHLLWFLSLAQAAGLEIASYRDRATGTLGRDERGRMAITRIVLRPEIEFAGRRPDDEELRRLHHDAHDKCFIANSLRSEVVVDA